ncbi:hypothetical protein [Chryseobacterium paridis]|uniref:Uncharacterized protein n=1 Tax=Chryseobacterium paridis TaxID=2800328 RepID=A0ABS1FT67_9FLAO|nr:hypothetical protein [Chryseobacterium paridis]MBK1895627.1 hypothetical protein [Chryseobacterium paridis]
MNSQKLKRSIQDKHPIKNTLFEIFFEEDPFLEIPESIILEAKHAYNVYYDRYMIQETVTGAGIMGYEFLLKNLKEENGSIFIYQLKTKIGFIACFFDKDENLLGVLWNHDKKG